MQQVVPALLDGLARTGQYGVEVVHPGKCFCPKHHKQIGDPWASDPYDRVDPARLISWAEAFVAASSRADIVLSIDHAIPSISAPHILMCNTLSYAPEAFAALGAWDGVVVPSHDAAERLCQLVPTCPVHVIHYGFPERWFRELQSLGPAPTEPIRQRVWLPHRPDPRKGHEAAIHGLANDLRGECLLEIPWFSEPGATALRRRLRRLAREEGVHDRVVFTDWSSGSAKLEALARAQGILLIGEFEETFGISALEAAVAGRRIVSWRQRAVREILEGTLCLTEVADPEEWVAAMTRAKPRKQHQDADRLANRFALASMIEKYSKLLASYCA